MTRHISAILLAAFTLAGVTPASAITLRAHDKTTSGPGPDKGAARLYAEAKRLLARGQPDAALQVLRASKGQLLEDREALVKGDALLALSRHKESRTAYESALANARTIDVAIRAARGLVGATGQLKDYAAQLEYLDALLKARGISRRQSLMFSRAQVLLRLGKDKQAAEAAWQLLQDYPTSKLAKDAHKILEDLAKKGIKPPEGTAKVELLRIRNLWQSRAYAEAERALAALEKSTPKMAQDILLERANIHGARRETEQEVKLLKQLSSTKLPSKIGTEVLERLGRLAMRTDDNTEAIQYFDSLAKRYPKSSEAAEVQYLAGWLFYNEGRYGEAATKLLAFAKNYRRWDRRPEALWFAGWSAYLNGDHPLARRAFGQILEDHPTSDMALWAHYWTGRIREDAKETAEARDSYRQLLKIAPMSYWGSWAITALGRLGERVALDAPPSTKPASIEQGLAMIGKTRPINVDRGIALSAVNLDNEALDELKVASKALKRIRNTQARVVIAEMLGQSGAHHHAFRMAAGVTSNGADLVTGRPYAWRAWRLAYPKAFWEHVEAAAKAHDIDPYLILSIMRTESSFRPWVRSPVGARGLMQIMPTTARSIGNRAEGGRAHAARYTRPESNIWLGAWYLKKLLERYDGQLALAVGAYNAGPTPMDRWVTAHHGKHLDAFIESLSYRETRRYIRRVIETYQTYRRLGGNTHVDFSRQVELRKPPEGAVSF